MKRIVVVDDESDFTTALKRGLEHHGFAVDVFNDPQAALQSFKPGQYDLMIIDIRMPRLTALTCTGS